LSAPTLVGSARLQDHAWAAEASLAQARDVQLIQRIKPIVNFKGELFSSTFSYAAISLIRLGSSLILTRLLTPQVYGIFAIIFSLLTMIELLSDVGPRALLIRSPRGNEPRFVHTLWTLRLVRGGVNFCIMFFGAPLIALIYDQPVLTGALRALSPIFLLSGLESMAFILAIRDRRSRISNYADLVSTALMTIVSVILAYFLRNQFAVIYGVLVQRAVLMVGSYFFYRNIGVGIAFDREAVAEQFRFARFVLPSSLLFAVVSQYDKVILLRLFDLSLLGVYGIASNLNSPVVGLIAHNAQTILYARCAESFRTDRVTACSRYYRENRRLLALGVILPAAVAGFAELIVTVLYDRRYAAAGFILMVLGLGSIVAAFQNASENLLVASGRTHTVLVANVIRVCSLIPITLLGYYLFGFNGFLWFTLLATVPVLTYYHQQQSKLGLVSWRDELTLLAIALLVFLLCFTSSHLLMRFVPAASLHLRLRRH
jgi:O-antigen/teichoic acid export membrane protein